MRASIFALTLASALVLPSPASATFPGTNGLLAFAVRPGERESCSIRVTHPRATTSRDLIRKRCAQYLAWSADGRKLVFVRDAPLYQQQVLTYDLDRRRLRRLMTEYLAETPAWSPDGRRISVMRQIPLTATDHDRALWVMDADGSNRRRLVSGGHGAEWSPTGDVIAYPDSGGVSLIDPDRGQPETILSGDAIGRDVGGLSWSPDGEWLALTLHSQNYLCDFCISIGVVRRDGSGFREFHDGVPTYHRAAWLPDGRRIAFCRTFYFQEPNTDKIVSTTWSMRPDGNDRRHLRNGCGYVWQPVAG